MELCERNQECRRHRQWGVPELSCSDPGTSLASRVRGLGEERKPQAGEETTSPSQMENGEAVLDVSRLLVPNLWIREITSPPLGMSG